MTASIDTKGESAGVLGARWPIAEATRRGLARVAWAVFVMWAVVSLTFVVNELIPTDPARMVAGPHARAQEVERVRAELGLERPLSARYAIFFRRLVHLVPPSPPAQGAKEHASCAAWGPLHVDLGTSFAQRRPVVDVIGDRLPRTVWLGVASVAVEAAIGFALGAFAAAKRRTSWDQATVTLALVGSSVPTFLVGLGLQYAFAYRLGWLPIDGFGKTLPEHLACVVLPALSLGLFGAAFATRLVRDEVSASLAGDHARTARAKGLSRVGVLLRHGVRNALAPIVTMVGLDLGALVGRAIVVESLFRWPGLGLASVNAMLDRDGPMVMGTVLVASLAVVVTNLAVDLAYVVLDPRVRAR
jgi:peptide/nickel transport system permease protein